MRLTRRDLASLLLAAIALFDAAALASEKDSAEKTECPRKFNDQQINTLLIEKLPLGADVGMSVRYEDCKYYVVMWPPGHPVDSNVFVELDRDGNLPPEVVKYGWHGDEHEDVSARKAPIPPYPARALAAKVTGSVIVRATVTPTSLHRDSSGRPQGVITDARIVQISPRDATELTEGLIDVLRQWRFNARLSYGTALARDIMLRFKFSIDGKNAADTEKFEIPADVAWQGTLEINR